MIRRTILCTVAAAAVALLASAERVATQGAQARARAPWPPPLEAPGRGEIEVLPVQGNVHVIIGAGANITVSAGPQGALLVDTGDGTLTDKVLAAIRTLSPRRPLRYVINTTHLADHTGGNEKIVPTGEIIPWREVNYTAGPQGALDTKKASVISHYMTFHRMAGAEGKTKPAPEISWPDNTFSTPQKRLFFNGEPVVIAGLPSTTDGNSVVLFRQSDVVAAGDLLDLNGFPRIDPEFGGGMQQMVDGLNRLIDLTVPAGNAEGGTLVVPGHGRIADHAEVAYYRDMAAIVRDRIQDMIKKGMTLAQVKAARPTRDWDARYGSTTGAWTTDMFVEAAFRSLSKQS